MIDTKDSLLKDIEAVRQIPIIPTMLEVICQTTGMGFAAVARVTHDRWLACRVRDEVAFGLEEGGELEIETTLCNEIRDHRQPIIIDHVDEDAIYRAHHTPRIYGLQSYISFPIILKDGTFFGTLCAIDARPAQLNNTKIIGMFAMFADLLSFHLQSQDLLERSYQATVELHQKNISLTNVNNDLDSFVHRASHDLKSPVSNIESLLDFLVKALAEENVNGPRVNQIIGLLKKSLQRLGVTIKDLATFVETQNETTEQSEVINLVDLVESAKQDLTNQIEESQAKIMVIGQDKVSINFPKRNLRSIVYNLLSNAIKYRSPERPLEVVVKMEEVDGQTNLSVSDNGLGIPTEKQDRVFTMFQRFHPHVEGSGLGLYIVKRMINAHQGQIRLNSTLNKGTTFTIIF